MKYIIDWCERGQTKTGKQNIKATLKDEQGVMTENVTLWGDYPDFANLMPGKEVNGDINVKQNGQYTNKTLYPVTTYKKFEAKPNNIAKAQETKKENIKEAQDNKEQGIKISSTIRMAVDIAIAESDTRPENIKEKRAWLWNEWEKSDKDFPPFN